MTLVEAANQWRIQTSKRYQANRTSAQSKSGAEIRPAAKADHRTGRDATTPSSQKAMLWQHPAFHALQLCNSRGGYIFVPFSEIENRRSCSATLFHHLDSEGQEVAN